MKAANFFSVIGETIEDKIVNYWKSRTPRFSKPFLSGPPDLPVTNTSMGLGDTLMLTDIPAASAGRVQPVSNAHCFKDLMSRNRWWDSSGTTGPALPVHRLFSGFDLGNGHQLQRLRRAFNIPVDLEPRGHVESAVEKVSDRVVIHLEPSVANSEWQQRRIHPQARTMYPQNFGVLQRFINEHPSWEFVEVGSKFSGLEGVDDHTGKSLLHTIDLVASCEWFLGIVSGPMHLATALRCKGVVIINFPHPDFIYLPVLRDTGQLEEEWLYPQHVHLHQDADGELVKFFDLNNLNRAFNGEVYPFRSKKFLRLLTVDC